MVTGEQPFVGSNYNQVMMEVIKGEYPRPREIAPEVPTALESVILRAMALEAPQRYQNAKEFRRALEAQVEELPVESQSTPTATAATEPPSRARGGRGWPVDTRETTSPRGEPASTPTIGSKPAPARPEPQWEFPRGGALGRRRGQGARLRALRDRAAAELRRGRRGAADAGR